MIDMANMDELRHSRINLFKNSITGKEKPTKVFNYGHLWSWKIFDAGYKFSEALYDYSKLENVMRHTFETYSIDCCAETGWRNPIQVTEPLGNDAYIVNDDNYSICIKDQCYMESTEYDALIKDPVKFLWEVFLPRKYSLLKNDGSSTDFRKFLGKFGEFGGFMGKVTELQHSFGVADLADPNGPADYWGNGYEILFCILRGIKGLSLDIRKDPEKVLAACEALDEVFAIPRLKRGYAQPKGSNPEFCVDMNPVLLGHTILSAKQFEKFYWPHLQRVIKVAEEQDKLVYVFVEGEAERLLDFFREFPQGRFALQIEHHDIFDLKNRLPNVTVMGGMPADLLGRGTPEECVDYTKKLVERLAYDGKYIFTENKMISFRNDCKRENLKAICDFLSDLRL